MVIKLSSGYTLGLMSSHWSNWLADYWSPEGWNWDEFSHHLPPNVLNAIAAIEIVNDGSGDNFIWNESSNGCFSIRSALQIIRRNENEVEDVIWKKVWKVEASERIRNFLWLVAHDSIILSNVNRVRRHLSDSAMCDICGESDESTLHIIRDCVKARKV